MPDESTELGAFHGAFTAHEAHQARRLGVVLAIIAAFFVLELAGALLADSVVLQAEAVHLLVDVLALGVSLLAMRLAVRAPTARFTFGLRRAEPVAAIFSSGLVLMTTAFIVVEAIDALRDGTPPRAGVMLVVATGALLVNGVSVWLLHDALGREELGPEEPGQEEPGHEEPGHEEPGHEEPGQEELGDEDEEPSRAEPGHEHRRDIAHPAVQDDHGAVRPHRHGHALNLRGAALHVLGDTLGAVAALVAAIVIRLGGPAAADPIASFAVAAILVVGSVRLLRDATWVILEAAPERLPVETIRKVLRADAGVASVTEVHVWTLGAGHDAITVRLRSRSPDRTLAERLGARLRSTFHAEYVTVQVDPLADDRHEPL